MRALRFRAGVVSCVLHALVLLGVVYIALPKPQVPVVSFAIVVDTISSSQVPVAREEQGAKAEAQPEPANAPAPKPVVKAAVAKDYSRLAPSSLAQQPVVAPLTQARYDAAYLHNSAPDYPALSRRLNEQGTVRLRVFVNALGKPEQVVMAQSSGHVRLDDAAAKAVAGWAFSPAQQGQTVVASWIEVPVVFALQAP